MIFLLCIEKLHGAESLNTRLRMIFSLFIKGESAYSYNEVICRNRMECSGEIIYVCVIDFNSY